MTLDIDTYGDDPGVVVSNDPGTGPDPEQDDNALYHLARATMLIFLILDGTPRSQVSVVPVGSAVDPRSADTPRSGVDPGRSRFWKPMRPLLNCAPESPAVVNSSAPPTVLTCSPRPCPGLA
jgi:hypothetical protein